MQRNRSSVRNSANGAFEFLQANCRIFVAYIGKETARNQDDALANWRQIVRIDFICPRDAPPHCCICLEDQPQLAKVGKCGHVFCWQCILLYLKGDETPVSFSRTRKCPICPGLINKLDFKTARFQLVTPLSNMWRIDLCLMKSIRGSSSLGFGEPLISILESTSPLRTLRNREQAHEYTAGTKMTRFAVMLRPDLMWMDELRRIEIMKEDSQRSCDTDGVIAANEAIRQLRGLIEERLNTTSIGEMMSPDLWDFVEDFDVDLGGIIRKAVTDHAGSTLSAEAPKNTTEADGKFETHYFYQSVDGQSSYLDPFLFNCLKYEYKDELCLPPALINLKVLSTEYEADQKRNSRYPFLRHLPASVNPQFVAVDLGDLLSDETYNVFEKELSKRRKNRILKENRAKLREQQYHEDLAKRGIKVEALPRVPVQPIPEINESTFPPLRPTRSSMRTSDPNVSSSSNQDDETTVSPGVRVPSRRLRFIDALTTPDKVRHHIVISSSEPAIELTDAEYRLNFSSVGTKAEWARGKNKGGKNKGVKNVGNSGKHAVDGTSPVDRVLDEYDSKNANSSYSLLDAVVVKGTKTKPGKQRREKPKSQCD